MINDNDRTQGMVNVEDKTSQITTIFRKDDISSLHIVGESNIYTEYFDNSKSRDYFKENFKVNEKVNDPAYLVGLALCNINSSYKHIPIEEIDDHLVIV